MIQDRISPGSFWDATGSSDVTDTTPVTLKAANSVLRGYVGFLACTNNDASVSTVIKVKNGSTVRLRLNCPFGGGFAIRFDPPLRGDENAAWTLEAETTSAQVQYVANGFLSKE